VLIVEDDVALRTSLVDILTLLNYQVQATRNGEEAWTLLAVPGATVDLIVSDIVMPRLSGVALFERLRTEGIPIPMILITGHPFGADLEALRARGLRALLPKPPSIELLAAAMAEALHAQATGAAPVSPAGIR
jgi:CheY-like chemotaxis protein